MYTRKAVVALGFAVCGPQARIMMMMFQDAEVGLLACVRTWKAQPESGTLASFCFSVWCALHCW
eukprot:2444419-Rhodomonas_salina.1